MKGIPILSGCRAVIPLFVWTWDLFTTSKLGFVENLDSKKLRTGSWGGRGFSSHTDGGLSVGSEFTWVSRLCIRSAARFSLQRRSKQPASRTLMCISKTKSLRRGRALICLRFMGVMKSGLNILGFHIFYIIYLDLNGVPLLLEMGAWDEKALNWKRGGVGRVPGWPEMLFSGSSQLTGPVWIKEEGSQEKKEHAGSFRGLCSTSAACQDVC